MLQFSIRSLFVMILVAAVYLGIAQTAGYIVAAGIFFAIILLVWSVVWHRRGALIYLRLGSAVFASIAIWFLAVDWSWFVADCPDCGHCADVAQYRVLGMPVRTQVRDYPSISQLILDDLGVPCKHGNCEPWHKYRFSGLVCLTYPRIHRVALADDPEDYSDAMAAKVGRLGAENPELAAELYDTVIRKHDHRTFWQTLEDSIGEPIVSRPSAPDPDT